MVGVLQRYSRPTYQGASVELLTRLLEEPSEERAETGQVGPVHDVRRRLGAKNVLQLVSDYGSGRTVAELQQAYGLSKSAVVSLLREHKVAMRRHPLTEEQLARVVTLYESGSSIREVAAEVGVPKTTVQNALAKAGVVRRPAVRVPRAR